jgi:hypothetical protein
MARGFGVAVPLCTVLVFLSCRVLHVSSFTFSNNLGYGIYSTAVNLPTQIQLKTGGRSFDDGINLRRHRVMMSQAGDLSEEDQAHSKKLADAWIRQDKAAECSKLLQVCFQPYNLRWAGLSLKLHSYQGKSVYLVGSISARVKSVAMLLSKRLGSYRWLKQIAFMKCTI